MNDKALVVLSGGQDSTTCLYWAIDQYGHDNVSSVTFDYGQRHRIELDCAIEIADFTDVPNLILPIDTFAALGGNALAAADIEVTTAASEESGLPNTFVPGRSLIFLTFAAAYAYQQGFTHLVTGVAQTDYSGYPDCREETMSSLQMAIQNGMQTKIQIDTPLMHLSRKETVELARELGALPAMAIAAHHDAGFEVGGESNGTIVASHGFDWLCVSPKGSASLAQLLGNELKLVYPQAEENAQPSQFEHLSFEHFFLQPMDSPERDENTRQAINYCRQNPRWKLSVQTHKYLGLD